MTGALTVEADEPGLATRPKRVVLVAAVASNGVIGNEGTLPWHLPEDLAHFKAITTGHTVVMGRKTFESIGRPLPNRVNIVITRQADFAPPGVLVAGSWPEALALSAAHPGDVMVIGGGEIYRLALPDADQQVLTEVDQEVAGDTSYPEFDRDVWVRRRVEQQDRCAFVWWERSR